MNDESGELRKIETRGRKRTVHAASNAALKARRRVRNMIKTTFAKEILTKKMTAWSTGTSYW